MDERSGLKPPCLGRLRSITGTLFVVTSCNCENAARWFQLSSRALVLPAFSPASSSSTSKMMMTRNSSTSSLLTLHFRESHRVSCEMRGSEIAWRHPASRGRFCSLLQSQVTLRMLTHIDCVAANCCGIAPRVAFYPYLFVLSSRLAWARYDKSLCHLSTVLSCFMSLARQT